MQLLGVALCVSLFNGISAASVYSIIVGVVTIIVAVLGVLGAYKRHPLYLLIVRRSPIYAYHWSAA